MWHSLAGVPTTQRPGKRIAEKIVRRIVRQTGRKTGKRTGRKTGKRTVKQIAAKIGKQAGAKIAEPTDRILRSSLSAFVEGGDFGLRGGQPMAWPLALR